MVFQPAEKFNLSTQRAGDSGRALHNASRGSEAILHFQSSILAATPIVALTASATVADRDLCLACGMDDFVSKPVNEAELKKVIERVLAGGTGKS